MSRRGCSVSRGRALGACGGIHIPPAAVLFSRTPAPQKRGNGGNKKDAGWCDCVCVCAAVSERASERPVRGDVGFPSRPVLSLLLSHPSLCSLSYRLSSSNNHPC